MATTIRSDFPSDMKDWINGDGEITDQRNFFFFCFNQKENLTFWYKRKAKSAAGLKSFNNSEENISLSEVQWVLLIHK